MLDSYQAKPSWTSPIVIPDSFPNEHIPDSYRNRFTDGYPVCLCAIAMRFTERILPLYQLATGVSYSKCGVRGCRVNLSTECGVRTNPRVVVDDIALYELYFLRHTSLCAHHYLTHTFTSRFILCNNIQILKRIKINMHKYLYASKIE